MPRVIIDTNVFISGLIRSPSCREVITAIMEEDITLVISPQILDELLGVLSRDKFQSIIVRENAERLIEIIKTQAILVNPSQAIELIEDDPDDNRFLEAALAGKVDFIISGNHHLLNLKSFHDIPILSSKEFLRRLRK